jgi:hypothetical protein
MHEPVVPAIGAACGMLSAVSIYFDARVPGKKFIVPASTAAGALSGALIKLLAN